MNLSSSAILLVPPSAALPVMAVAILSVWAAHCTPEACPVHESALESSPVHESAPKASPVHVSTPVPPEVAASAAELTACLVVATEAIHELAVCLVMATEAVYELSVCPATAMKAVH